MSANRRHTDVSELGFTDMINVANTSPIIRVQGFTDDTRGKRFNRAVRIIPSTFKLGSDPTVMVMRVKWSRKLATYIDTGETMCLRWSRLNWITWKASGEANGTWCKVTAKGRTKFRHIEVRDTSTYNTLTGESVEYANRGLAVIAAMRVVNG